MSWTSVPIYTKIKCDTKCAGLYRIRIFKKGNPYPINRLFGTDSEGILSIGMSKNLEKRRVEFFSVVYGNKRRSHSEAISWWLVRNVSKFKDETISLKFEYTLVDDKVEAQKEVKRLLREYVIDFAELPPLNGALPGRIEWYKEKRSI